MKFVSVLLLVTLFTLNTFKCGPLTTILKLPDDILKLISSFIGAKNQLPNASRHFLTFFTGTYPIHSVVAEAVGIPELKTFKGVNSDILDLLELPKFKSEQEKENFIFTEIVGYGKFTSIKNLLFSKILDNLIGEGIDDNISTDRLKFLSGTFFNHGDLDVKIKFLGSLHAEVSALFFRDYLMTWNPQQRANFFNQIINHPKGKFITRRLISIDGNHGIIFPFLVAYNVPVEWWIGLYSKLSLDEKTAAFSNFFYGNVHVISEYQFVRIKEFISDRQYEDHLGLLPYIASLLLLMTKGPFDYEAVMKSLNSIPSHMLTQFAIYFDAETILNGIIKLRPNIVDELFENFILDNSEDFLPHVFEFITELKIKTFLAISKFLTARPQWTSPSISFHSILTALIQRYEINSFGGDSGDGVADGDGIVLVFECELIEMNHEFPLPEAVKFYLPKTKQVLAALLRWIVTSDCEILELLMAFISAKEFEYICSEADVPVRFSNSILKAIRDSDQFKEIFMFWNGNYEFGFVTAEDEDLLDQPIDKLKGLCLVDVSSGDCNLKKDLHFERLIELVESRKCSNGTILDIYDQFLAHYGRDGSKGMLMFYQKYRRFFHYWIRSRHWKMFCYVDETEILDYLKSFFPIRVLEILKIRNEKLLVENDENPLML